MREDDFAPEELSEQRYELGEEISSGDSWVVLRAKDRVLQRSAAVKMPLEQLDTPRALAYFSAEARLLARLRHAGIPPLYTFGVLEDGRPLLAMGLAEGRTLAERFTEDGDDNLTELLGFFEQVCRSLRGSPAARNVITERCWSLGSICRANI